MFYEGGNSDIGLDREALEHILGLDVPVYVQYGRWLGDIFLHRHPLANH